MMDEPAILWRLEPVAETGERHRNDIYGDIDKRPANDLPPAIPAATVVLLKDGDSGVEVLMLYKNSKISFGGMWVFPGGKIDEEDFPEDRDVNLAARNAAARETLEESGIKVSPDDFAWFAHWTPPASTPKRFSTWFFAVSINGSDSVSIDGGEIQDHAWVNPHEALQRHARGETDLAPPTWVTLYHLSLYQPTSTILDHFRSIRHRVYETRVVVDESGTRVALWEGDAGYHTSDAEADGLRHRLVMRAGGFDFQHSAIEY